MKRFTLKIVMKSMVMLVVCMTLLCVYGCSSSGGGSDDDSEPEENTLPVAVVGASQTMGTMDTVFALDASLSSDPDGSIVSYAWDFGDGQAGTGDTVTHSYVADGTYTVTMTVTDNDGGTALAELILVVSSTGTLVDEDGGEVVSDDGKLVVTFPPGMISGELYLRITEAADVPSGMIGMGYSIEPSGLSLDQPVTITLTYDEADLPSGVDEEALWVGMITGGDLPNWTPLSDNTVDPDTNAISASLSELGECGVVGGTIFSDIALTVYVVDTIESGHADQFTELGEAMDYLNTNLEGFESGKIIIQTDRTLSVDALNFLKHIVIELDEGNTAVISGPADGPLSVTSAGALGLSGLNITCAAGMAVQGNSDVILDEGNFPATTVAIGSLAGSAKAGDGTVASGSLWNVSNSSFLGPFQFQAYSSLTGKLNILDLEAPSVSLRNTNYASVTATVSKNITDDLSIQIMMGQAAAAVIDNNSDLDSLAMDLDLLSGSDVAIRMNTSASAVLSFQGQGLARINAQANNYGQSTWNIGTGGETVINSTDEVMGEDGQVTSYTVLEGSLAFNQNRFTAEGEVNYEVQDAATLRLRMTGSASYQGDFNANIMGALDLRLANDTTITGYAQLLARGNLLDMETLGAAFRAGLSVDAKYVTVGANVSLGDTLGSGQIDGVFEFLPPDAAPTNFMANNVTFMLGANLTHDIGSRGGFPRISPTSKAGGSSYQLSNVTVDSGGSGLLFNGISEGSITIEDSDLNGDGGIGLFDVQVPVTISGCNMNGNGVQVAMCSGTTTISNCTITGTGAGFGVWATMSGNVAVSDSTIDASGGSFSLYSLAEDQHLIASNCSQISGQIIVGAEGVIGLTGNTFSGAVITDGNQYGGLINDPMDDDNSGMSPNDIHSLVDWDGNGCADYPPEANVKDAEGNCVTDGVSPAS